MNEPSFQSRSEAGLRPEERSMALLAHLGALAGTVVGFGHILVPLVVWLVKKDESEFVRRNALESLNFQISMTIWVAISSALTVVRSKLPTVLDSSERYSISSERPASSLPARAAELYV